MIYLKIPLAVLSLGVPRFFPTDGKEMGYKSVMGCSFEA